MDENKLRQALETTGFPVPDDIWHRLEDMGVLKRALQCGAEGEVACAEVLKAAFRELSDWHHVHAGRHSDVQVIEEIPEFESDDLERALALNEWFAKDAAANPEVCSFRQKVLGGSSIDYRELESYFERRTSDMTGTEKEEALGRFRSQYPKPNDVTLTDEEAYALLSSPAAKCLCDGQFKEWGIPVVGHKAQIGVLWDKYPPSNFRKHDGRSVTLTFLPSGDAYEIRASRSVITVDGYKLVPGKKAPRFPTERWRGKTIKDAVRAVAIRRPGLLEQWGPYDAAETTRTERIRARLEEDDLVLPTQRQSNRPFENTLEYPGELGHLRRVKVWPGSVLDELRCISDELAEQYHWSKANASWFVLTGTSPPIRPLWASTTTREGGPFADAVSTFRVLPWVSWVTVSRIYRQVQCRLHMGATRKQSHARAIEVFRFVTHEAGARVYGSEEWKSLSRKWLEQHPREKILVCPSRLRQYYNRARTMLLAPDFDRARQQ